jgi:hypothetical protein
MEWTVMANMIAPCRTADKAQADRCYQAMLDNTTITETFSGVTVTGQVQSVVDNRDAAPRNWSITFYPKQ